MPERVLAVQVLRGERLSEESNFQGTSNFGQLIPGCRIFTLQASGFHVIWLKMGQTIPKSTRPIPSGCSYFWEWFGWVTWTGLSGISKEAKLEVHRHPTIFCMCVVLAPLGKTFPEPGGIRNLEVSHLMSLPQMQTGENNAQLSNGIWSMAIDVNWERNVFCYWSTMEGITRWQSNKVSGYSKWGAA